MSQKVIRISHRDMNEYIKQYTEKALAEKPTDNSNGIVTDFNSSILKDEEVKFLLAILNDVVADNDHEEEMIQNIKNTLNTTEIQKNEKR